MMEKLCVFCKHFSFYGGSETYSEWTVGSPADIDCLEDVFIVDGAGMNEKGFRKLILTAQTCHKYEPVK